MINYLFSISFVLPLKNKKKALKFGFVNKYCYWVYIRKIT
ncbi:hypothetical protein GYO_0399 [Bacillus spizizenii TU-B-10]|uniref:Uncharacterized protein n=1 Tax=Bacillus spizizenii (strain DSM 15029 / JCM 12233 / NBRC 101239 / NRRL B-23049 / TU-B-10) TaxID=1052585 RepID=G4NQN3_BACS4|nr:hypothetical protein GYO_0399 [Bacillus spizizenii TU-B-10]